jgi:hypothetical protein
MGKMKRGIFILVIAIAMVGAVSAAENATPAGAASSAPALATLDVIVNGSPIQLSPKFESDKLQYSAEVASWFDKVAVTAETADNATKVSGSGVMNIYIGENDIPITVTAADGTSTVYTVVITRDSNEPLTD